MDSDVHSAAFDKMAMLSCCQGDNHTMYLGIHLTALLLHGQPDTSDTPASSQVVSSADSASPVGAGPAAAAVFLEMS